jgi:ATP-dependent RNA helicase DeaD
VHGDHPFKVHDRPVHPSAHHRPVATPHRHGEMERRHQSPRQRRLDTEHYRLAVGRRHGTRPNMIVGALANELGIPGAAIGPIRIHDSHTTVGLPADLPPTLRDRMRRIRVSGRQIGAEKMDDDRY